LRSLAFALPALATLVAGVGCVSGVPIAEVEPGEWLTAGAATNTLILGRNAFIAPAPNLTAEHEAQFYLGNSFFNDAWVESPASTTARDGLGPLFNARSCAACHFLDGRAQPPQTTEDSILGTLLRLSVPEEEQSAFRPEPTYGGQLQDQGITGFAGEATLQISWEEVPGSYADGTEYSLRRPTAIVEDLSYGEMDPATLSSLRVAPQMLGLGLLEGISMERLLSLADAEDLDGDGISGRISEVIDSETQEAAAGRFGWKGEQPRVRTQCAAAFSGDLGLTSSLVPFDDCSAEQVDCLEALSGGEPEVQPEILDAVALYSAALAVPVRREWDDEEVLRGKWLFTDLGCDGCHVRSHTTSSDAPLPELADQDIWPYTDLLLHDLGEGLSDGRPVGSASASEWRTPALWGLGLVPVVNGHDNLLHDGRARGFAEAILWHEGEAAQSTESFKQLNISDRDALVRFLESL